MPERLALLRLLAPLLVLAASCSGFTSPDECRSGETAPCESPCGPGAMTCQADGTWGACEITGEVECLPAEYGRCDLLPGAPPGLWFCSATCHVGPCMALCPPGDVYEDCEAGCGLGTATCQDDGSWGECREYVIPDCRPGDIATCTDGSGHRRCDGECHWGECNDAPCAAGELSRCGRCASQVCLTDGTWTACAADETAVCAPGETDACEAPCGPGERICDDRCTWSDCLEIETVECHPGQRQMCATTLYCGLAYRLCSNGCEWMDCIETGD